MLTFLFLNQTLLCDHSLESSRRDDFNEGHIIGIGWEMRKHENSFVHYFLTVALEPACFISNKHLSPILWLTEIFLSGAFS